MARRAVLRVSDALLVELCKAHEPPKRLRYTEVIQHALPDGAQSVGLAFDGVCLDVVGIVVESDAFEDIPDGQGLPFLPAPVFRIVYQE